MKTTASQAMECVHLCGGHGHDHGRDRGLEQTWRRLFRWWRLGLGERR
jgi:hypothetical protein